jgi:hypothetical protein
VIVLNDYITKVRALKVSQIAHKGPIVGYEKGASVIVGVWISEVSRPKNGQSCLAASCRPQDNEVTLARQIQDFLLSPDGNGKCWRGHGNSMLPDLFQVVNFVTEYFLSTIRRVHLPFIRKSMDYARAK